MKNLATGRKATTWLLVSFLTAASWGCSDKDGTDGAGGGAGNGGADGSGGGGGLTDRVAPTVTATIPEDEQIDVAINRPITAAFSEAMDEDLFDDSHLTVTGPTGSEVLGSVSLAGTIGSFVPDANLEPSSVYTVTVDGAVTDLAGNELGTDFVWSFTTGTSEALGPMPVNLGTAGSFVLLAKAGISATTGTMITGNLGVSPAAESAITGFGQTRDSTNTFSISAMVTGRIEASNMAAPTPTHLTTAIGNMETAYTDAAGRTLPDFTELGAGDISGLTIVPGLYKWSSGVLIDTDVTLTGGSNDVWIFQIAQDLTVNSGVQVTLGGEARAQNVYWQVAGQTMLGTTVDFQGNLLCQTQIVLKTGASLHGRALAQTAVTLDANTVVAP